MRQAPRHKLRQYRVGLLPWLVGLGLFKTGQQIEAGQKIDDDGIAAPPVRRNLKNDRPAESPVGKQQRLGEDNLAEPDRCLQGNTGQAVERRHGVGIEGQRNQTRTRLDHIQTELAGHLITETGGPHLGDRRPAGGDDQRVGRKGSTIRGHGEAGFFSGHARDADAGLYVNPARLVEQHIDNLLGRAVAKQLAMIAFVIGNVVLFDQRDEIVLGVAGQRRDAKTGIGRQKIGWGQVEVGEVGASTAGNPDLLPHLGGPLQQQYTASALVRFHCTHQASRPGAKDDDVEISH